MSTAEIVDYQMAKRPTWNSGCQSYLLAQIAKKLDKDKVNEHPGRARYNYNLTYKEVPYHVDVELSGYEPPRNGKPGIYKLVVYDVR